MNFLDPYDITNASTNTPPPQPEQSLNEEVTQVLGSFNKFWGGFRQQSQAAFQTARKDFGDVVQQAQKELSKLTTDTTITATQTADQESTSSTPTQAQPEAGPSATTSSDASGDAPTASSSNSSTSAAVSGTVQSLFSRLQSAIPPNVVTTVQANLPETLRHPESIDFAQLRSTLTTEFERVQGVTRAQAEEYVRRSEGFLRDTAKEAEEILRDAVKIIPPDERQGGANESGLVWDGSDMWMLPAAGAGDDTTSGESKGKNDMQTETAVATRAEALLKRLKTDFEILKHDPETEGSAQELYTEWQQKEVESKEGGFSAKVWQEKAEKALAQGSLDAEALQATHDALVPSKMSTETFWKRYFFRVHQIDSEEAKRKALLQSTAQEDEDLTWDDDDEEDESEDENEEEEEAEESEDEESSDEDDENPPADENTLKSKSSTTTLQPPANKPQLSAPSSGHGSLRESSEESYDVVSNTSASGAGNASTTAKKPAESDSESDESDWE